MLKRAIDRGLTVADLDLMTLGMLLDFLVTCRNDDQERQDRGRREAKRYATDADIEAF